MSKQPGLLADCLDELRGHLENRRSGIFSLTGLDDSTAVVVISNGIIESVSFQGRRGDFAVELLKNMKMASCSFRSEPRPPAKESELSKRAIRWLTGVDGKSAAPPGRAAAAAAPVNRQRRAIEAISFESFGPITGVVCAKAFANGADLHQVIDELAGNLPPGEAGNFRNALAAVIERSPGAAATGGRRNIARHRQAVERVSFAFLGPISGVLCKKAFAECGDLAQVIDLLAGNLQPNEARHFRREIDEATGLN